MIININELIASMKLLAQKPKVMNYITGFKTSKVFDKIFGRDIKAVNSDTFFNTINTKEIELVTWSSKGAKFIPVGRDNFNAEKMYPYDVKLMTSYTPKDLQEKLLLRKMKYPQVYKEMVSTFLKYKKRVVINQCHEFFKEGKISYQVKDNDNLIITKKVIDYTQLEGAIQYDDCTLVDAPIHDWSDPATTDELVLQDVIYLIQTQNDYSDGVFFNEGTEIQIWMGNAAYSAFVKTKNPDNDVIRRKGFNYTIGDMELPVIKDMLPYKMYEFDSATGTYELVDYRGLATDEVMIVNIIEGAYMIRDMKYITVKNYDKDGTTPFVLTGKVLDHDEGVEFAFASSPLVYGNTKAVRKAKVVS